MIFAASFLPLSMLLPGCDNEPEYDLSQIPVAEQAPKPPQEELNPPSNPEDGPPIGDVEDIANNDCVPPYGQGTALNDENSVTISMSLDSKVLGEELMVDIIQSEHGELQYGVMCKGTAFSFQVPKMLGSVRAAVFIDKDHNGPSKGDPQGVTKPFTITDQAVTAPPIVWNTGPLSYYNFDSKENPPIDPIPDGLEEEDE